MAIAREITTPSGKRVWRATRVLTVKKPIHDSATGEVLRLEKQKKRVTGQGSTTKEAETRLEENLFIYKQKQSLNPHDPSLFAQERIAG
ncbi:hypothetical protein EDF62_3081 [Leucobacter luti]|uniref:Uncharacterized protein n=1 Tax=Leucobacter luti TaxID=340320 RepID=A0A4R6RSR1_9MICO|nr:hypothetical protein [Leucobacter luti]TDP89784.1 hypothetical protein EDF62_3081 [Leucobacter luti]